MTYELHRADARNLPLEDESVDEIVTSPPYFNLRSYRDGDEHYDGQIGSEATPQAFLEALWEVTKEMWRVLRPDGIAVVNLGDKRAGSGGHNNSGLGAGNLGKDRMRSSTLSGGKRNSLQAHLYADDVRATRRNAPDRYQQAAFGRTKGKMLLPHRYAIGCADGHADPDGIGWIVRQDEVWWKPNGLPESVTDRPRDSHEYWFMMTKSERYWAAMDEVREEHLFPGNSRTTPGRQHRPDPGQVPHGGRLDQQEHPLGKLPGSVRSVPSEPLRTPIFTWADGRMVTYPDNPEGRRRLWRTAEHATTPLIVRDLDHFAAFPTAWPEWWIQLGTTTGWCLECGERRTAEVARTPMIVAPSDRRLAAQANGGAGRTATGGTMTQAPSATITGYRCACPTPTAPTRPAVVLDPFLGTGTTVLVADVLGRHGIGIDLSADYLDIARWRINDEQQRARIRGRVNRDAQMSLGL